MKEEKRKATGMQVGSASLVMVFAVLCLTIFAVLSVVTARGEWNLAEKSANAVTAYYEADCRAVEIFDEIAASYDGTFTLPQDCSAQVETVDGVDYLTYAVAIDDGQELWVEVYYEENALKIAHWMVQESGTWIADESINVWGG